MTGYKILNKDRRGKQWGKPITKLPGFHYSLDREYVDAAIGTEIPIDTEKCAHGFHFCDRMMDAIRFAPSVAGIPAEDCDLENFVFVKVVAGGSVAMETIDGIRSYRASHIRLVREYAKEEALELARKELEEERK